MTFVTVLGSPRKQGNTARVLGWTEAALIEGGHRVERIDITDYIVRGCVECHYCQNATGGPSCSVDDDAPRIFERMVAADGFVLATPLFCWGPSAQLKALMDRTYSLVRSNGERLLEGRRAGLVVTAAGPFENNCDLIGPSFDRLMDYLGVVSAGHLILTDCTTPDALDGAARQRAARFAAALVEK